MPCGSEFIMGLFRTYKDSGSIRSSMLGVFLLLVLLPASVIIVCSLLVEIRNTTQLATSQLESVAVIKEAEIKDLLEQMHSYLANTLIGPTAYSSALVLLERTELDKKTQSASRYARDRFSAALLVSDLFQELFLVFRSGQVVLSTIPANEGASFSPRLLNRGLRGPAAQLEGDSLFFAIPVKNERGETVGAMCGRGSLKKLNQIMEERTGLGESGESYLIDANGFLVTPSRFSGYRVGTEVSTKGADAVLTHHDAGFGLYRDYRGIPVLGVYRWLPELDVGVLAERDQSEVFSPIRSGVAINLVVAFVALLLASVASVGYSKTITAPIAELADTAARIAAGDLGLTVQVKREDEIGTLGHAFNSMTRQLSELIAKLRSSETKYRIVAENTYGWEFWRSPDGRFQYVSPSCERISGYKPADFYADDDLILRIVHEEDRVACAAHQAAVSRGDAEAVCEMEFRITAADGTQRWISHVCTSVYDETGGFMGKRGTNRDITEAKRIESELLHAKQQAESANRAKSSFISSMSHELRTPLNAIMGYTQILLRDETVTDAQRPQLEALRKNGEHLLALINDVLDVGKLESGKIQLEEIPFHLPSLLLQLFDSTMSKAKGKNLNFRCECLTPVPVQVRGDEEKLKKSLVNLLDNAVRYTRQGGIVLRFSYQKKPPGTACFEVVDTGIGIPLDQQGAVFQPFTQLARGGLVQEGTGLGLTVAKHLVAVMLGKMELESEPGKGSVFRVELPLPAVGDGDVDLASEFAEAVAEEAALAPLEQREPEVPPPEKLGELFELAMLGDMRKIAIWAGELIESGSRFTAFAAEVRGLAEAFKANAIVALVEKCLAERKR